MADEHEEGPSPWTPLIWLIVFLAAMAALWIYTGGPARSDFTSPLIQGPFGSGGYLPFGTAGTSTDISGTSDKNNGAVIIADTYGATATDSQQEYVVLEANPSNAGPVSISGWTLKSAKTGRSAQIGGAIETPRLGTPQSNGVITLAPGEEAIITTGRSPVGMSFRENECTGYFGQFQNFYPTLAQSCPYPGSELSAYNNGALENEDDCAYAAASAGSCRVLLSIPSVSAACHQFLTTRLTYNGCVDAHQSDRNFKGTQWRVYLGQSQALWSDQSDAIELLDSSGKLVASDSY